MKFYRINNKIPILEQADVYAEEIASGVFHLAKNRHGDEDYAISSDEIVSVFNINDSKVAIESNFNIHTNFEPNLPKSSVTL